MVVRLVFLPGATYPQVLGANDLDALVRNVDDGARFNCCLCFFVPAFSGMVCIAKTISSLLLFTYITNSTKM